MDQVPPNLRAAVVPPPALVPPQIPQLSLAPSQQPNLIWNSTFLITINTNQTLARFPDPNLFTATTGQTILTALHRTFDYSAYGAHTVPVSHYAAMFFAGGRGTQRGVFPPFEGQLITTKVRLVPEIGPQRFQYHFHGLISIDHTLALRLHYPSVVANLKAFARILDPTIPNFYVNIRFVHTTQIVNAYIDKNEALSTPQLNLFEQAETLNEAKLV